MKKTIAERFGLDKAPFGRFWGRTLRYFLALTAGGLAASATFGLGVIYAREEATQAGKEFWIEELPMETKPVPVITAEPGPEAALPESLPSTTPIPAGGEVVASKNGTAYYLPWCSGAKRISTENLVTFPSKEAAEEKGYKPAKNCKGI